MYITVVVVSVRCESRSSINLAELNLRSSQHTYGLLPTSSLGYQRWLDIGFPMQSLFGRIQTYTQTVRKQMYQHMLVRMKCVFTPASVIPKFGFPYTFPSYFLFIRIHADQKSATKPVYICFGIKYCSRRQADSAYISKISIYFCARYTLRNQ